MSTRVRAIEILRPGPPGEGMDPGQVAEIEAAVARTDPGTLGDNYDLRAVVNNAPANVKPPVYHARWFGMKADGVTDDTAAFVKVRDEVPSGAVVQLPEGTIVVSAQFLANKDGLTWRGVPGKTIVKVKDGSTSFNPFRTSGATSNVVFEDITVDLNKDNTTAAAGNFDGVGFAFVNQASGGTGLVVRRCAVINGHKNGIAALGESIPDMDDMIPMQVTIEDCYIENCARDGIVLVGLTDSTVRGNRVVDCGGTSFAGISALHCRNFQVERNRVIGSGVQGIVLQYCMDFTVAGNISRFNGQWGIAIGGGIVGRIPNRGFTITGNICTDNGQGGAGGGITIDPTISGSPGVTQEQDMTITGNVCLRNLVHHGIYFHTAQDFTITGNICKENGQDGIGGDGRRGVISGNTCVDNGRYGLSLNGTPETLANDSGHFSIGSNFLDGNASGDFIYHAQYNTDLSYVTAERVRIFNAATGTVTLPHPVVYGRSSVATAGNITIALPTASPGVVVEVAIVQGGGHTVTWPSTVKWPGGVAPTITATAGRTDIFRLRCNGTNWMGEVVGQDYAA